MDIEWEWYDGTEGIEVMTTVQAREVFDFDPDHTVVPSGVMALAVNEGEAGFAIFGTPEKLAAWLDRARAALDRAIALDQGMC